MCDGRVYRVCRVSRGTSTVNANPMYTNHSPIGTCRAHIALVGLATLLRWQSQLPDLFESVTGEFVSSGRHLVRWVLESNRTETNGIWLRKPWATIGLSGIHRTLSPGFGTYSVCDCIRNSSAGLVLTAVYLVSSANMIKLSHMVIFWTLTTSSRGQLSTARDVFVVGHLRHHLLFLHRRLRLVRSSVNPSHQTAHPRSRSYDTPTWIHTIH